MSPGLTSRPSLSVAARRRNGLQPGRVSPGLTSRPSLSGLRPSGRQDLLPGVAGINLPAFVERSPARWRDGRRPRVAGINLPAFVERGLCSIGRARPSRVAGINLPAFVERPPPPPSPSSARRVSPGLTSRPSLSVAPLWRPLSRFSSVAGINLPAFVERISPRRLTRRPTACRRD